jgi:hypothetical protein
MGIFGNFCQMHTPKKIPKILYFFVTIVQKFVLKAMLGVAQHHFGE